MLNDYQGAFKDLNKADFHEPNNAFTLHNCENVKRMLEDLDKANFLEPNNAFTLQSRGNVK
jgi:tetratricopeptide (TPR) repeat protein